MTKRKGLGYRTVDQLCADRDDAKIWIIRNQFGRRNLSPYARAELALKLGPLIAVKVHSSAGGGDRKSPAQKSAKAIASSPVDTRKEIAKAASVSHDTIAKAKLLAERAPEPVKDKLRRGETTIHYEYQAIVQADRKAGIRNARPGSLSCTAY